MYMSSYIKRIVLMHCASIVLLACGDQQPIWQQRVDTSGAEQPLVIVIPSYNNAAWIERTLNSVFSQEYSNYRVVYLDDCSTDESVEIIERYIRDNHLEGKIILVKNDRRWRKLRNLYLAIHRYCADEEVVVTLDCDDFLAHPGVFKLINEFYSDPDVWFMYGGDEPYPKVEAARWGITKANLSAPTPDAVIRANSFRQFNWVYMHIRTFRAWLFKLATIDEMVSVNVPGYQGKFYPACIDYIFVYPMLEMAQRHMRYNDEFVYYWNAANPINSFKVDRQLQALSAMETRKKAPYEPLIKPMPYRLDPFKDATADLVIFSDSTPAALDLFIQSAKQRVSAVEKIIVVYQADSQEIENAYQQLAQQHAAIQWHKITDSVESLRTMLAQSPAQHCVVTRDAVSIVKPINVNSGILALQETGAYAFFYHLGAAHGCVCSASGTVSEVPCQEVMDDWHVWKFACDTHKVIKQHAPAMTLYRKADITSLFDVTAESIDSRIEKWAAVLPDQNKAGILFSEPCVK